MSMLVKPSADGHIASFLHLAQHNGGTRNESTLTLLAQYPRGNHRLGVAGGHEFDPREVWGNARVVEFSETAEPA
jgi:hypothetical protein